MIGHRSIVAYLILSVGVCLSLLLIVIQDSDVREAERRAIVVACEDRNTRDTAVAAAITLLAADAGFDIETLHPLLDAMEPINCERLVRS